MDDTIENLLEAWVLWLNCKYNLNVRVEDCSSWDMSQNYPMLSNEQIVEPLSIEAFWDYVQPKEDAQKVIQQLIDEHQQVYICTASHYATVGYKMRAIIEKYFPAIDWKHIIIASNKQMLNCDIIIDDAPHNLIGHKANKILYDVVHNRNFAEREHKIKRCKSWEDISNYIHHLDWFYYMNEWTTVD